ncbi:MAG: acyl-CoA thioesterase [Deltaproteobacteria bacterium]|nr:acyl-CoA thioesterase [Deltaproteobacteria bacterium]
MPSKTVKETRVTVSHVMQPQDANVAGNVHGGVIMKLIDTTAGVVATRHARSNVVTASIDQLDFHFPAKIGNLLTFRASINMVGRTSMEIGVRVDTEDLITGRLTHTASAYLTFVALDENGRPREVPRLVPETEEEKRRLAEARERAARRRQAREQLRC